tara:strand:+ start:2431 stop:2688 length:258 start_codon:yes stop_codon:yes gene_type:complete
VDDADSWMSDRETYIETQHVGGSVRVAAVDAATGEEVVFQVPPTTTQSEINRLGMAKLAWKMGRADSAAPDEKRPGTRPGRGISV